MRDDVIPAHERLTELLCDSAEPCQQDVGLLEVADVHRGVCAEGGVTGTQRIVQLIGELITGFTMGAVKG
jgi:hypothetical protein